MRKLFALAILLAATPLLSQEQPIATIDGKPITESSLLASFPPSDTQRVRQDIAQLRAAKEQAVREVIGKRTLDREAAATHQPLAAIYASEFDKIGSEIDAETMGRIRQLEQQVYDDEKQLLDNLVAIRMVEKAAQKQGVTLSQFEEKLAASVQPVTQADIDFMRDYEANRQRAASDEPIETKIARALRETRIDEKRADAINALGADRPRLTMLRQPARQAVASAGRPRFGPETAPVQLILFSDYECQYCAALERTMRQLVNSYGDKVSVVFRDFPLAMHPNAIPAAKAARCAAAQGKFWEYHDTLFADQTTLDAAGLDDRARKLGLDLDAFHRCENAPATEAAIREDMNAGRRLGVTITPTLFVNGRMVAGVRPPEELVRIIDQELASAAPPARGTD